MGSLAPPTLVHRGRGWPSAEVAAIAAGWRDHLRGRVPDPPPLMATVMVSHPEAVALFFALAAFSRSILLLPPDPRGWPTAPDLPAGTTLALLPALGPLLGLARERGLDVLRLPDARPAPGVPPTTVPDDTRIVWLTSGSTGRPRPVARPLAHEIACVVGRLEALGLPRGAGVVGSLPLDRAYGFKNVVLAAAVLGGPAELLDGLDYGSTLAAFTREVNQFWPCTPVMAAALVRAARGPRQHAPTVCTVGATLSERLAREFRARFGRPLRGLYGSTETSSVAVDAAPPDEVRWWTVGTPERGVEVRIGDDPRHPLHAGANGRIWVRNPWLFEGYGIPPRIEPREDVDGFWPTPDLGHLEADGFLVLTGRRDDTVRTGSGHLVHLGELVARLLAEPGVSDAVAVPLDTPTGPVVGALVATDGALDLAAIRTRLARGLAPALQPRILEATGELPHLPSGKPDRLACLERLRAALGQTGVP